MMMFQFHTGAINTTNRCATCEQEKLFQFHTGAINT